LKGWGGSSAVAVDAILCFNIIIALHPDFYLEAAVGWNGKCF
jgi:hypothetical protein